MENAFMAVRKKPQQRFNDSRRFRDHLNLFHWTKNICVVRLGGNQLSKGSERVQNSYLVDRPPPCGRGADRDECRGDSWTAWTPGLGESESGMDRPRRTVTDQSAGPAAAGFWPIVFFPNELLQAQLRFKPVVDGKPGEVAYDDPEQQRILGKLNLPEEAAGSTGKLNPPKRTDYAGLAQAYALRAPETAPVEKLARLLGESDLAFHSLIESARLPAGHFGMIWDITDMRQALTPHYQLWTDMARFSTLRARIALAQNQPRKAFNELTVIFRLMETLDEDPVILAGMIRATMRMIVLNVIWEGLESRSWHLEDLLALNQEVDKWRPIEEQIRCWQGDRALSLTLPDREMSDEEWATMESLLDRCPGGRSASQAWRILTPPTFSEPAPAPAIFPSQRMIGKKSRWKGEGSRLCPFTISIPSKPGRCCRLTSC